MTRWPKPEVIYAPFGKVKVGWIFISNYYGVKFTMEPTEVGEVTITTVHDKWGNLIQLAQR